MMNAIRVSSLRAAVAAALCVAGAAPAAAQNEAALKSFFEGKRVSPGDGAWRDPRFWSPWIAIGGAD